MLRGFYEGAALVSTLAWAIAILVVRLTRASSLSGTRRRAMLVITAYFVVAVVTKQLVLHASRPLLNAVPRIEQLS